MGFVNTNISIFHIIRIYLTISKPYIYNNPFLQHFISPIISSKFYYLDILFNLSELLTTVIELALIANAPNIGFKYPIADKGISRIL